jgi:hypothetical protein
MHGLMNVKKRMSKLEGTLIKLLGANPVGCASQARGNAFDYAHGKAAVWPQQSEHCGLGIRSVNRVAFEDNSFPCVQSTLWSRLYTTAS